jgi:hypothetical protein
MRLAQKAFDDPSIGEHHRADAQWRWISATTNCGAR